MINRAIPRAPAPFGMPKKRVSPSTGPVWARLFCLAGHLSAQAVRRLGSHLDGAWVQIARKVIKYRGNLGKPRNMARLTMISGSCLFNVEP